MWECKHCGSDDIVMPKGPETSPILLVGDEPSFTDVKEGIPFTGNLGSVLSSELSFMGISLYMCRRMNLFQHPTPKGEVKALCQADGIKLIIKEAKNKKLVLLMGSDVVTALTGHKVSDVTGLEVKSKLIHNPRIICMINPTSVFHGGAGEIKFAMKNFSKIWKEVK